MSLTSTLIRTPDRGIECLNCNARFDGSRDSARRHGWRIGWTDDVPTFCGDCYGAPRVTPKQRRADQAAMDAATDPLF